MHRLPNVIDGKDANPRKDRWIPSVAPATGEAIAEIARSGPEDVDDAVQAAKRAFPSWSSASVAERADLLEAIGREIEKRADELAILESTDTGKAVTYARDIDVPRAVRNFRFFAGAVRHDETGCHEMHGA